MKEGKKEKVPRPDSRSADELERTNQKLKKSGISYIIYIESEREK